MGRNLTGKDRKRRLEKAEQGKEWGNTVREAWELEKVDIVRKIPVCERG